MKTCPFCAEEIRDEAIKCRFCGSFLPSPQGEAQSEPHGENAGGGDAGAGEPSAPAADEQAKVIVSGEIGEQGEGAPAPESPSAPPAPPAKERRPSAPPASDAGAAAKPASAPAPEHRAPSEPDSRPRHSELIYEGTPRWQTYLRPYLLASLALLGLPIAGYFAASAWAGDPGVTAVAVGVPLAAGAVAFALVHARRRAKRIRITSHNIEREYGFLSRRIDVLELWRCRDVRYRQSLSDRLLRIAHLELYTSDVASPHFVIEGMPSSRELFQRIRDAIERERSEHRDYHRYTG